jgi:hypothetical protein
MDGFIQGTVFESGLHQGLALTILNSLMAAGFFVTPRPDLMLRHV